MTNCNKTTLTQLAQAAAAWIEGQNAYEKDGEQFLREEVLI
jgi:hypothetical protein